MAIGGLLKAISILKIKSNSQSDALPEGDMFDILDFSSVTSSFDTFILPELANGLSWDTSSLLNDGVLSVVAVPEPASFGLLLVGASSYSTVVDAKANLTTTTNNNNNNNNNSHSYD